MSVNVCVEPSVSCVGLIKEQKWKQERLNETIMTSCSMLNFVGLTNGFEIDRVSCCECRSFYRLFLSFVCYILQEFGEELVMNIV